MSLGLKALVFTCTAVALIKGFSLSLEQGYVNPNNGGALLMVAGFLGIALLVKTSKA